MAKYNVTVEVITTEVKDILIEVEGPVPTDFDWLREIPVNIWDAIDDQLSGSYDDFEIIDITVEGD